MVYRRTNYKKAPVKRNLRKRGFGFSGEFGKNVPFLGGSKFNLGTRAVKTVVRRELARREEIKFQSLGFFYNNLLNNTLYTFAPTQGILQGTDAASRSGDSIFLKNICLKGIVANNSSVGTLPYCRFRILGVWLDNKRYPSPTPVSSLYSGVPYTDVFFPSQHYSNALIDNRLGAKVICDRIISVKTDNLASVVSRSFKINCPINQKVNYVANTGYFRDAQLYFIVIPHNPSGGTSATGSITLDGIVTYRDS